MTRSSLIVAAMLASAAPAPAREVQSLQPLLLDALHYGQAQGVLTGPIAETFAQLFQTTAPLLLSVRQVADLTPSCKRLEVTASQEGVWDRNSTQVADRPEPRRLAYQVSMCMDGSYYTAPQRSGR
jgi:hypothetical protein